MRCRPADLPTNRKANKTMSARTDASRRLAALEAICRKTRWARRELAKMDAHESWEDRHRVYALKLFLEGVEQELAALDLPTLRPLGESA